MALLVLAARDQISTIIIMKNNVQICLLRLNICSLEMRFFEADKHTRLNSWWLSTRAIFSLAVKSVYSLSLRF
jgi:hypothetical protein